MTKPYLILLPGWGASNSIWTKINYYLIKDFNLIYIQWNNITSLNEFKRRVINIIEEKQLNSFSLLGWSLGSLIAQEIVLDTKYTIDYLILIGGTSCFINHKEDDYTLGWPKRIVERMKYKLSKNHTEILLDFYQKFFLEERLKEKYNYAFKNNFNFDSINSLAFGLEYLIKKDFRNQLLNITTPLLLLHGDIDNICPLDASLYIKNKLPNSTIKIIKNAGHIPFFTHPCESYNAIHEFIHK